MIASWRFCRATSRATIGISHEPGTFTISILSAGQPERVSASSAPASSRSVIKLLNRDTMIAKRSPAAERFPSNVLPGIFYFPANTGLRFSINARVPSCRSSVAAVNPNAAASNCSPCSSPQSSPTSTASIVNASAIGPLASTLRTQARLKLISRSNVIDETDAIGFRRIDDFARNQHLERPPSAHQPRQPLGSAIAGDDAELYFRL